MTTAICFDLDGTLVHSTRSYGALIRETCETHGIGYDDELATVGRSAFEEAFDALEAEPYRKAMAAVVDAAGTEADSGAMVETLREKEYAATTVPDAARTCLTGLAADGDLGLITNGVREWQVGKLDHHGLTDQFDAIVASYETGAHKPAPDPFDEMRERLPAEEYVMVGNDYEADVEGARAAGFVPIHYEDRAESGGPDLWETVEALL